MQLQPGSHLGPYEIISAIGAGGMGEVYRARDTELNRDVAIKVLPELFTVDHERVARFTREAQTLAALNHPNIAQIYGLADLGRGSHTRALVMEFVEGEDLSAMIDRAAMPPGEAVPIARQIADALETAHEAGIIHRDLKPANVKVRKDGAVKVLDFGLAKAIDPMGSSADALRSPTLTARATQLGTIIGTAAYMAPEQARGKAVDKRADIWAFGVILYEMLTGRRAFDGDDISSTLAAVLTRDPEWGALPRELPPALDTLIHRCVERDPKTRLRDIGEARLLLSNPDAMRGAASPPAAPVRRARVSASWIIAAVSALAAGVLGVLWATGRTTPAVRIEAALAPPSGHSIRNGFALSPDGRRVIVEAVQDETGTPSLWVRELASSVPARLPGTDGGTLPFWSPDGREIAFFANGKLKKTDLQGSPPQIICDAPSPRGGAWGPDATIVLAGSFRQGLEMIDARGGTPKRLTSLDEKRHEKSHRWPVFLPDGKHLLFLAQTGEAGTKDDTSAIEVLSLESGARTRLVASNSSPMYSADGYLLFWREGALRAQELDAKRLTLAGDVLTVAREVEFDSNELAHASVAAGTLLYSTASTVSRSNLVIVDRTGRPVRTIAESVLLEGGLALSHDGARLAAAVTAQGARDQNIWLYDLVRGTAGPLTFDEGGSRFPVWSADDAYLIYANDRKNDGILFRRPTDGRGEPEQVGADAAGMWAWGWSRDGKWLVVTAIAGATSLNLMRFDLQSQRSTPLVATPFAEDSGALSPDDRWLAYQSDETGRWEVYVRSLDPDAGRWRISNLGGRSPVWRSDGRELFFLTPQGGLMAADVDAGPTFRASAPRELFRADFRPQYTANREARSYAPFPDGRQFVVDVLQERRSTLLTLVTNWIVPSANHR